MSGAAAEEGTGHSGEGGLTPPPLPLDENDLVGHMLEGSSAGAGARNLIFASGRHGGSGAGGAHAGALQRLQREVSLPGAWRGVAFHLAVCP